MPQTITVDDLVQIGAPIAAKLLGADWRVSWAVATQEQLSKIRPPGPNLAVVKPIPTRKLATAAVVSPWPDSESLSETLWHELTHAMLSPLTELVEKSGGAVMVEEQIVERLGILLSEIPAAARRAVTDAANEIVKQVRARAARELAVAPKARSGGPMDPIDLILAAVEAAAQADDPKEALTALLGKVRAIKDGSAPPVDGDGDGDMDGGGDMDGDEPPPVEGRNAPPPPAGAKPGADPPPDSDSARRARKGPMTVETANQKRARIAREQLEADAAESKAILADQRTAAKTGLVESLRARLAGHSGLPAIEKRILAAPTYERAKEIADTAAEMGGGQTRARALGSDGNPIEHNPAPDPTGGAAPFTKEQLVAEGLPPKLAEEAVAQWKIPGVGKKLAEQTISMARARLHGHSSGFMPPAKAAQKAS